MDIRDFKPGQTVYIVGGHLKASGGLSVREAEVAKVGRKYVTIAGGWGERFREVIAGSKPYLIEKTEIGSPRFLFPTEDAVSEYREREELKEWVRTSMGWDKVDRYTLEQLRATRKALEGQKMEEKAIYSCVDKEHDAWVCGKCGYIENFEADGPVENGWHFCPGCGREITVEEAE